MSQVEGQPAAEGAADTAAEPAATPQAETKAEKKARTKAAEQPKGTVKYVSRDKHTFPFSVLVRGVNLEGAWNHETGIVEFDVPVEFVEPFEMHHHFQMGNVVKAAE